MRLENVLFKDIIFNSIINNIPHAIFWKDTNLVFMGCNKKFARQFDYDSPDEVIGKTDFEFPFSPELIKKYHSDDREVLSGISKINFEETQTQLDGTEKTVLVSKIPLYGKDQKIVGVLGTYLDITEMKARQEEVTWLKLENESLKDQEKFTKLANQVVHDIRSPLSSLLMIIRSCTEIPEADRIALREAAISIGDIANHLLSHYQKKEHNAHVSLDPEQPVLLSALLLQLLTDKKYQYRDFEVKFDYEFNSDSYFSFIRISQSALKRMLSNLINNAVEAFDGRVGRVCLGLNSDHKWVKITVSDNGKGMSPELVNKIMQHTSVTAGKKLGHGIGLTQVWDTIEHHHGELAIDSEIGKGTEITVSFPRIKAPSWIAEEILLQKNDTVIILDDDTSIHRAWDSRFELILNDEPNVKIMHFQVGLEALSFILSLTEEERDNIFLLTDYELLKQEINGLYVIKKSKIQRSILVTSHYADRIIREIVAQTNTKILPKHLASDIPIKIYGSIQKKHFDETQEIEVVIVDDDKMFVDNLVMFVFKGRRIDQYDNPENFLSGIARYSKETKFLLDNNFANSHITGFEMAEKLHALGYKNLYILSGEDFGGKNTLDYMTIIRKDDIDRIMAL